MAVSIGDLEGAIRLRDNFTGVLDRAAAKFAKAGNKLDKIGRNMANVGQTISTRISAPLAVLSGLVLKTAIDFESSFTGVRKTVDATDTELMELQDTLRILAAGEDPIPIDIDELNAIAEAAGQLGIKTENIAGFTKVMAALGVTTNMSATVAASSLARLANITGMQQTEFDRLGSTIVALGNNFATTEQEIVDMSLRLAGAGTQIGLSEGEILGLATALSSVGIRAEQGGSAFSRVMNDIAIAVAHGGDAVVGFATVAGMSSQEFVTAFEDDAAGAIQAFIQGLGSMQDSGGPVLQTLEDLGFGGIRVRDVLLRMAGGSDLLVDALNLQESAWSENTALTREAELRYGTFSSQLTIFWNRVKDIAITIGSSLLPVLANMLSSLEPIIDKVRSVGVMFAESDSSVKLFVIGLVAFTIVVPPLVFVLGQLAIAGGALGLTLGGVTTAASSLLSVLLGPVGLAVAAVAVLAAWEPSRAFFLNLANVVLTALSDAIDTVITTATAWWKETEIVRKFLANLVEIIVRDVTNAIDRLIQQLVTLVSNFIEVVSRGYEVAEMFVEWLSEQEIVQVAVDTFVGVLNTLRGTLSSIVDVLVTVVSGVVSLAAGVLLALPGMRAVVEQMERWVIEAHNMATSAYITVTANERLTESSEGVSISVEDVTRALEGSIQPLEDVVVGTRHVADELDNLTGFYSEVIDLTGTATTAYSLYTDQVDNTGEATVLLNRIMALTVGEIELLGPLVSELTILIEKGAEVTEEQLVAALEKLNATLGQSSEATTWWGKRFGDSMDQVSSSTSSMVDTIVGALDHLVDSFSNVAGAADDFFSNLGGAITAFASGDIVGTILGVVDTLISVYDFFFSSTPLVEERLDHLFQLFADGAGTLEHFDRIAYDLTRTLEKVAEEGWDAARAQNILNDNFDRFIDLSIEMGREGYEAIEALVEQIEASGVGLENLARRLQETYEEAFDVLEQRNQFILDSTESLVDGLLTMLGETGAVTRDEIEFAAQGILQAFSGMIEAGIPVAEAIGNLAEVFELVRDRGLELELDLGEAFGRFGEMMIILADENIQRVIERLNGMEMAARAAGDMGLLTAEQFDALSHRLINTFNTLVEGGLTGEEALATLQGPLQLLHDLSQQYGFTLDENTQSLLDQAEAQGIVQDRGLEMGDILIRGFDKLLEGLNRLIVALGGVPVEFDNWGRAADRAGDRLDDLFDDGVRGSRRLRDDMEITGDTFGRVFDGIESDGRHMYNELENAARRAARNAGQAWDDALPDGVPPGIGDDFDGGGFGGGFADGSHKFLDFGAGTTETLHNVEQIVTYSEGESLASMVGAAIVNATNVSRQTTSDNTELTETLLMQLQTQQDLRDELQQLNSQYAEVKNELMSMRARERT